MSDVLGRRVIDLGAGQNPDPRATETADIHPDADADYQFDLEDPWPFDDASVDALICRHVLEHIDDLEHVVSEASRALRVGGWFEVVVPIGIAARTDPDHVHVWTFETPALLCGEFDDDRHWDPAPALTLDSREVDAGLIGPMEPWDEMFREFAKQYPNWGCYHADKGELTARYRRIDEESLDG